MDRAKEIECGVVGGKTWNSIISPEAPIAKSGFHYEWKPKKNITTYELALCLPLLFNPNNFEETMEKLPSKAKRHFFAVSNSNGRP